MVLFNYTVQGHSILSFKSPRNHRLRFLSCACALLQELNSIQVLLHCNFKGLSLGRVYTMQFPTIIYK